MSGFNLKINHSSLEVYFPFPRIAIHPDEPKEARDIDSMKRFITLLCKTLLPRRQPYTPVADKVISVTHLIRIHITCKPSPYSLFSCVVRSSINWLAFGSLSVIHIGVVREQQVTPTIRCRPTRSLYVSFLCQRRNILVSSSRYSPVRSTLPSRSQAGNNKLAHEWMDVEVGADSRTWAIKMKRTEERQSKYNKWRLEQSISARVGQKLG